MGSPRRTADYQQLRTDAAARHGLVGLDQLRALGVPSSTTGDWCASGRLSRLAKGVYAVPELVDDRSLAAVCLSRPEAVASHRAAANLWGLDGIEADVVEVTVPRQVQLASGTVHRSDDLAAFDVVEVQGIRCTDPTRTLVELGAVIASDRLERAVESALRRRLTTVSRLQRRISGLARSGRRGPASLRHVLEPRHADAPPTESEVPPLPAGGRSSPACASAPRAA
ncbi:MAG TPA: type IV toxin-antitoxin system AbiEi family antitoxin domain-containing protein, partial [Acidimicrobiales bacterium]|nr:type IV toxin-antitoxin system AbiEi family antitoxin domain-containing protein [Acidimicrobiales bacterium]